MLTRHARTSDGNPRYDRISAGYQGELWCELIPRSFDIIIQAGETLNQAMFFHHRQVLGQEELSQLHDDQGLLYDDKGFGPFRARNL